jgi:hypothetical protein
MKTQGGGLQKETTHYEDLYSALMALASTIFQDDYEATHEPQHVHAANKDQTRILDANYNTADLQEIIKCISTIDDIGKKNLLGLLRKFEHLFDGTSGNFETSDVKLNLKEDSKPYHAKAFPVPKNHHDTLKHGIERLVKLGWAAHTLIIPKKWYSQNFILFQKMHKCCRN